MVTISLRRAHPAHCLDQPGLYSALLASWQSAPEWQVGFYMIMPDHLHFFCVPGLRKRIAVATWCRKWKSLVSMAAGHPSWRWLPNCWDTQMRSSDQYDDKRAYVHLNPVRKGLVTRPEDWPYQGVVHEIRW